MSLEGGIRKKMIASLPMYDTYIARESTAALWAAVVAGCDPNDLTLPPKALAFEETCHAAWSAGPSLFLSQTCGNTVLDAIKHP
jgi:hypothetical protein